MTPHSRILRMCSLAFCAPFICGWLAAGCGGGGGGGISNDDPGDNDLNVVVAFGDSLTSNVCDCESYPSRLAGLIGKTVCNEGVSGSTAASGSGRVVSVIQSRKGAFMLILYGINDMLYGRSTTDIVSSLEKIVNSCRDNHVVPVLATYPIPIEGHEIFAGGTYRLNRGIRELADAYGLECVDLEDEFSDNGEPDASLYEADGLHPNDTGNQVMALSFADLF